MVLLLGGVLRSSCTTTWSRPVGVVLLVLVVVLVVVLAVVLVVVVIKYHKIKNVGSTTEASSDY